MPGDTDKAWVSTASPYSYLHPAVEKRALGNSAGLFAQRPIPADTLVSMWGGVVVDDSALADLPPERASYFIQIEEGLHLGPPASGVDDAEFFNHSCDPNCGMSGATGLRTMRRIDPGEQLTFDYAMAERSDQPFTCACASPHCRGTLRAEDTQQPELRERYRGFFSPWIERALSRRTH
jgi:hypothetical protein